MSDTDHSLREALETVQQAAADLQRDMDRLAEIKATIRVNALRGGATTDEVEAMVRGEKSFVDFLAKLCDTRAALAAAPQPEDDHPDIPDTPEERAYRKGWNEGIAEGHKLTPIDDPAAPHPAPAETDWGPDVGKEVLPAYQTTPADREALVDVVAEELRATLGTTEATWLAEDVADALLARGLRLPGGDETMAWAVVGEDGKVVPASCGFDKEYVAGRVAHPWDRIVRVAIRVVEGGDDAA